MSDNGTDERFSAFIVLPKESMIAGCETARWILELSSTKCFSSKLERR